MTLERKLPLEDFLKSTEPAYKESRLLPFWEDIRTARSRKYTLAQIRQWLNQNGVDITIQGLSRFIIVQTTRESDKASVVVNEKRRTKDLKPEPNAEDTLKASSNRKDQRELTAAQFIRDDNNTVLNILKDQSK